MAAISACLFAWALVSCGGDKPAQSGKSAEGEILPAAVSDAMLPIDSVRSQPPLAPRASQSGKPGGNAGQASADAGPAASAAAAEPAEPTPAAE